MGIVHAQGAEQEAGARIQRPEGLTTAKLCSESGELATEFCPKTVSALVIAAHEPEAVRSSTPSRSRSSCQRLVGLPKEDALARIETLKLKAKVVEKQVSGVAAGIVAQQSPAPGTLVKAGSQVTLVVSAGASADAPPKAAFTVSGSPKVGKPVSFDGSESTDDGTIASYYWEFGDGQTATGKSPSHTLGVARDLRGDAVGDRRRGAAGLGHQVDRGQVALAPAPRRVTSLRGRSGPT